MFERRYPITTKVDEVIVALEELLVADSENKVLTDDYYDEIRRVISELRVVSDMTRETETY